MAFSYVELVSKSMRVIILSVLQFEGVAIVVHFFKEVVNWVLVLLLLLIIVIPFCAQVLHVKY